MRDRWFLEAAKCRIQAKRFADRPEESVLLRLAREFEHLAQQAPQGAESGSVTAYEVKAVDAGKVIVVATTDAAAVALANYRDALGKYRRVWGATKQGETLQLLSCVHAAD